MAKEISIKKNIIIIKFDVSLTRSQAFQQCRVLHRIKKTESNKWRVVFIASVHKEYG